MKHIKPYAKIYDDINGQDILKKIEACGRICYKSEHKICEGSAEKLVANLIKRSHEAMLEHVSVTVKFVVDRGISHEIVRHRLASFSQESTRYCNYLKDDFDNEITCITPFYLADDADGFVAWESAMRACEISYFKMLELGYTAQEARAVLPNSLKTELMMTANLREWRHFFKLRAANSTGMAHPQMLEVTVPLLEEFKQKIPVVFDDIQA